MIGVPTIRNIVYWGLYWGPLTTMCEEDLVMLTQGLSV